MEIVVPDSQAQLIRRLSEGNPMVRELLDEHLRDQGQLQPHVYLGDVTRWFVSRVSTGAKHDATEARLDCDRRSWWFAVKPEQERGQLGLNRVEKGAQV